MYRYLPPARLIESAAFVAAPLAGLMLSQLGWEVIRLDPPGGGPDAHRWPLDRAGHSLYWAGLNKGKKSVVLDTRSAEGRELAQALAAKAGLLLTNLPRRGWTDPAALQQRRQDMIAVQVRGNADGSNAVDYTVNCAVGFPFVTGPEDISGPVNHVFPCWDALTGMHAALALLAAERRRAETGEGTICSVALSDVAIAMVGHLGHLAEAALGDGDRPRYGNALFGAFGRDFATADGRSVMVVALTRKQWRNLGEATGLSERFAALGRALDRDLDDEGERFRAREAIALLLEPWFAERPLADIARLFNGAEVCWGPYQTFRQLLADDPRCSPANPMMRLLHQPEIGDYLTPGSALALDGINRSPLAPAPRLGQHTEEVLAHTLGLSGLHIARLIDGGIAATAVADA